MEKKEEITLIDAFKDFKEEKNIDRPVMMGVLKDVFLTQIAKTYGSADNFDVIINVDKGDCEIYQNFDVVEEVENPNTQITLDQIKKETGDDDYEIGDVYTKKLSLASFGRRGILNIRQNLQGRIMDIDKANIFKAYSDKVGEIFSGEIYHFGEKGITRFSDYRTRYSYTADGSGVYGKFGFLWRPVDGIRIGGAVQTPTIMEINERWRQDVNVNYTDASFNGSAKTPEGDYSYRLRSPYRLNAGAAFTFAGMALLSADYEMTDYSTMKFMSKDGGWSNDTFSSLNDQIRNCMGVSHMVRVGAEFKPLPEIAVRAGYNFTTTPEYVYEGNSKTKLNDRINAFSVGLGYSSNGSFFADIAARMTMLADEYISPYADYLSDLASPMILNKRDIYNVTATIGWRF